MWIISSRRRAGFSSLQEWDWGEEEEEEEEEDPGELGVQGRHHQDPAPKPGGFLRHLGSTPEPPPELQDFTFKPQFQGFFCFGVTLGKVSSWQHPQGPPELEFQGIIPFPAPELPKTSWSHPGHQTPHPCPPQNQHCSFSSPTPANSSCVQHLGAPGRDAEGGIMIPAVWEWLQGHETAKGACSNSATPHTTRPLCATATKGARGAQGLPRAPQEWIQGLEAPATSRD